MMCTTAQFLRIDGNNIPEDRGRAIVCCYQLRHACERVNLHIIALAAWTVPDKNYAPPGTRG